MKPVSSKNNDHGIGYCLYRYGVLVVLLFNNSLSMTHLKEGSCMHDQALGFAVKTLTGS